MIQSNKNMHLSELFIYNGTHKKRDYFIMFLLIMCSGNPAIQWQWCYIASVCLLFPLVRKENISLEKPAIHLLSLGIILFLAQLIEFGWNSFPAIVNHCAKILLAYYILRIISYNFRVVFLNVMYFFCAVSLIFFGLYVATGTLFDLFPAGRTISIGIWGHCMGVNDIDSLRNSGPFWEPGAFACYLCLIPLMYIDSLKELVIYNRKKCFVIITAFITTFSTTGYVVLLILLIYYFVIVSKKQVIKVLTIPLIVVLSLYVLSQDFIGEKLQKNYESIEEVDIHGERVDHARFTSAIFDWYYIQKHPIIGNGFHSKTRYADHLYMGEDLVGFGNGFTGMVASMGIPYMLYFLYLLSKNERITRNGSKMVVLCVILLLQGEYFLNFPLFYVLAFFSTTHHFFWFSLSRNYQK